MRQLIGILALTAVVGVSAATAQKIEQEKEKNEKINALRKDIAELKTKLAQKEAELEKLDPQGEKILDAAGAPNEAPLRSLKELARFKLSNLRFEVPAPGQQALLKFHYELEKSGEFPWPTVVVRTADGQQRYVAARLGSRALNPLQDKAGDLAFGLGYVRIPENTKNLEVFLVATDKRWEDENFRPTFKISNSVVIGDLGRPLQLAREWTPEEAKMLNDPPPLSPDPGANRTVGKDTKHVGLVEALTPANRFADPKKRPLVGFYYSLATFEPEKDKKVGCVSQLSPCYHERQPSYGLKREMAKEGYAVGAVNLKTNPTVTAFQLVYMKIKPDGTLDTKDSYTGEWIGEPGPNDKEGVVTGNGRKVIGANVWHWGRVFALALVLE
ncbi:hypothetical protein FTUN_7862 [Frigoriglobus tundricola]|uniref:Uncharacterized protein n=2 Tax=Frigoriglobus tundricola TaxID=2774151 RepID=A0A6M5Z1F2_9BACT|nr:hypothetical protein FTUN_7862 [Frigoriglobus tundricola]